MGLEGILCFGYIMLCFFWGPGEMCLIFGCLFHFISFHFISFHFILFCIYSLSLSSSLLSLSLLSYQLQLQHSPPPHHADQNPLIMKQIKAAEDILSLTRTLKEAWLFGKLQTLGATSEVEMRARDAAERVGELVGDGLGVGDENENQNGFGGGGEDVENVDENVDVDVNMEGNEGDGDRDLNGGEGRLVNDITNKNDGAAAAAAAAADGDSGGGSSGGGEAASRMNEETDHAEEADMETQQGEVEGEVERESETIDLL